MRWVIIYRNGRLILTRNSSLVYLIIVSSIWGNKTIDNRSSKRIKKRGREKKRIERGKGGL
jgi:hypothetical protein